MPADAAPAFDPPPGWKPGDPIPGQSRLDDSKESYDARSSSDVSTGEDEDETSQDGGGGIGFDFILNPDLEVVDDDESTDEYSSDDH